MEVASGSASVHRVVEPGEHGCRGLKGVACPTDDILSGAVCTLTTSRGIKTLTHLKRPPGLRGASGGSACRHPSAPRSLLGWPSSRPATRQPPLLRSRESHRAVPASSFPLFLSPWASSSPSTSYFLSALFWPRFVHRFLVPATTHDSSVSSATDHRTTPFLRSLTPI